MTRCRVLITGRVQGVGYRYFSQREAVQLGLTGWVRNISDGSVEMLLEGDADGVRSMLLWCERGPGGARVDEVRQDVLSGDGECSSFSVRS